MMYGPQVVVVMGVTGVGKSTFIKHATGRDVVVGHGQQACTSVPQCFQIPGTNIHLMDTPGFDDTNISDAKILENITNALVGAFKEKVEIQGALYIHPVTEVRMRGSGRKNLIMFRKVLGDKGMTKCRLVTTKWSLQDQNISEAREQELCEKPEFWGPLMKAGAQTVRFADSQRSAMEILRPLIQGPAFAPLLLQEVLEGKPLAQTQAGRIVNDDVEEAHKAHLAEIKDLKEQEAKALKEKDLEFAKILREEREEHQAKMKELEEAKEILNQKRVEADGDLQFGRWVALIGGATITVASGGALAPAAAWLYGATEVVLQGERDKLN